MAKRASELQRQYTLISMSLCSNPDSRICWHVCTWLREHDRRAHTGVSSPSARTAICLGESGAKGRAGLQSPSTSNRIASEKFP